MRGHVIFDWELTPARLAIWTLRVIKVGRHECPGLHGVLSEHLGDDAQQAIQATQVLTFVMQKGRQMSASSEAFSPELEDDELAVVDALNAIAKGQTEIAWSAAEKLAGAHSAIAMGALTDLAAIYQKRGMFAAEDAEAPVVTPTQADAIAD
ncbi:MAG: hypothetical protein ABWZ40_00190 [Caulobacterales bacterium]